MLKPVKLKSVNNSEETTASEAAFSHRTRVTNITTSSRWTGSNDNDTRATDGYCTFCGHDDDR